MESASLPQSAREGVEFRHGSSPREGEMGLFRRRRFLVASSALIGAPFARAQEPGRRYRVGVLVPFSVDYGKPFLDALRKRLATHGFVDGKNLSLEPTPVSFSRRAARDQTSALIQSKVDAIFSLTTIATLGAQDATRSVPIVFSWVADPVATQIVSDYAKPGGNITGVTNRYFELVVKRIELVRELVPNAKQAVVLAGYFDSTLRAAMRFARPAIDKLGLTVAEREAGLDWTGAITRAAQDGAQAAVVITPFWLLGMETQAREAARAALEQKLPVVYSESNSVEMGGLISYATSPLEDIRRGADYVARVLRGEAPGNLAIDQASRFELVVNQSSAQAIGLKLPRSILARADRVIE
jgi:putative ABC transport system substrate-binding protein